MFKIAIPKISKEDLAIRYTKIKPMVRINNKLHWLRLYEREELSNMSFYFSRMEDARQPVRESMLVAMPEHDFICLHTYGSPNMFKPSVAEVLSQLTEEQAHLACAFEIIEAPETVMDLNLSYLSRMALNQGFHISRIRLYRRKF